ncbi:hypothetical protein C0J52_14063 [Blattella germanica]|nr:hypothetical protein C0J52_14063 [Blattella germanica]
MVTNHFRYHEVSAPYSFPIVYSFLYIFSGLFSIFLCCFQYILTFTSQFKFYTPSEMALSDWST